MNGIAFPRDFQGYSLRDMERTYTTPEVIGALLDAVESVRERYPNTCDLYFGDFSLEGGGWMSNHRSHQNGRDVDLGMYAKGNRYLSKFIPMNAENLDVPKTWELVESIVSSQRVQYIFLDKSLQRLLYDYAMSRGRNPSYLDRLFGNSKGAVVQHIPNHKDHIHVRFYAPWSALAAQVKEHEKQRRTAIELAQQAYLPKKVHYYVKGTEPSLDLLAQSFGVSRKDLCQWNNLRGDEVLPPGSCLVFYKRGFEFEPVHLAQSLRPNLSLESPPVQLASIDPKVLHKMARPARSVKQQEQVTVTRPVTCKVQKGDTLWKIAKRHDTTVEELRRLNGIKGNAVLKSGQQLKVGYKEVPTSKSTSKSAGNTAKSAKTSTSNAKSTKTTKATTYTIQKGDTLGKIASSNRMKLETLCELNGFKKNTKIRAGQEIKLVTTEPASKNASSSKNTASKAASPSTRKAATAKDNPSKVHTIKSGDTLWAIAKKYGTTPETICRANGLSAKANLQPGAKITIP